MNQILMTIMAAGVVLGGTDRLLGNKFGYGDKFEEGFRLLGSTALSMAGMICLAPVLADVLGRIVVPLYRMIGADPAMFGSILAIDMGGYQLATELAADSRIGSYAGIVAAAIFGCTLVFTIPVGMGMIRQEDRSFFARGIMLGLAAMPAGLLTGGLFAGLSVPECLLQNLPVFAAALLLLLGLWKIPEQMVKGFCLLANGIRILVTVGLVLAAVESLRLSSPARNGSDRRCHGCCLLHRCCHAGKPAGCGTAAQTFDEALHTPWRQTGTWPAKPHCHADRPCQCAPLARRISRSG